MLSEGTMPGTVKDVVGKLNKFIFQTCLILTDQKMVQENM